MRASSWAAHARARCRRRDAAAEVAHCCPLVYALRRSLVAAFDLVQEGVSNVAIMRGGWNEWIGGGRCVTHMPHSVFASSSSACSFFIHSALAPHNTCCTVATTRCLRRRWRTKKSRHHDTKQRAVQYVMRAVHEWQCARGVTGEHACVCGQQTGGAAIGSSRCAAGLQCVHGQPRWRHTSPLVQQVQQQSLALFSVSKPPLHALPYCFE